MGRWLIAAVALAATSAQGAEGCRHAEFTKPLHEAVAAVHECFDRRTKVLERSGEAPQSVAQAVMAECGWRIDQVEVVAINCTRSFWMPSAGEAASAEYAAELRTQSYQRVISLVLEIRAARVAPALSPAAAAPPPAATPPANSPQ